MLNIVVPMAGRGSRFAVAGYADPKPLIPVHSQRMIQLVIRNLTPSVAHRFIFVCQREHIQAYNLETHLSLWAPNCEVVAIDGVTEGAACTVLAARDFISNDSQLMIANSDQYVDCDIDEYLAQMKDLDGLIMTMTANDPKWSYVQFAENGDISNVVEKKVVSHEATVGIYNFRRGSDFVQAADEMIAAGDRSNGEYYVAPAYNYLIKRNRKFGVFNVGSEGNGMYGLGIPADLTYFLDHPVSEVAK